MNPITTAAHDARPVVLSLRNAPVAEAGKLPPLVEHRLRHVAPTLANPIGKVLQPYIIGHGQQLARKREAEKAAAVEAAYAGLPYPTGPAYVARHTFDRNVGGAIRVSQKIGEHRRGWF